MSHSCEKVCIILLAVFCPVAMGSTQEVTKTGADWRYANSYYWSPDRPQGPDNNLVWQSTGGRFKSVCIVAIKSPATGSLGIMTGVCISLNPALIVTARHGFINNGIGDYITNNGMGQVGSQVKVAFDYMNQINRSEFESSFNNGSGSGLSWYEAEVLDPFPKWSLKSYQNTSITAEDFIVIKLKQSITEPNRKSPIKKNWREGEDGKPFILHHTSHYDYVINFQSDYRPLQISYRTHATDPLLRPHTLYPWAIDKSLMPMVDKGGSGSPVYNTAGEVVGILKGVNMNGNERIAIPIC